MSSDVDDRPAEEPQDRRDRLKAARLRRSSFTEEAVSVIRKGLRKSGDASDGRRAVKMGVRLESASGSRHIDADVYRQMQEMEDDKRRQLKVAAAQLFEHLALQASYRLEEQELLCRQWRARNVEQQVLSQAIDLLKRRRSAAEGSSATHLRSCADLLSRWLKHEGEGAREVAEKVAKDVAIFQQEMLRLQQLLPEASAKTEPLGLVSLGVQLDLAQGRRERLSGLGGSPRDRGGQQPDPVDDELQQAVAAAMELLDVHEPKAVKVRMAGLKPSAIGDEDTFKRLVAEKFAEAIQIDRDQIRVRRLQKS